MLLKILLVHNDASVGMSSRRRSGSMYAETPVLARRVCSFAAVVAVDYKKAPRYPEIGLLAVGIRSILVVDIIHSKLVTL